MRSRYKNAALALILLGVSTFIGVLIFEAFLRLTGIQTEFFYQLDPDIGASYIPNKSGWHSFMSGQQRQWIQINSYGFRDREWKVSKEPGRIRIALLGDSYIAAMEVAAADRVSDLLEDRLNRECNRAHHYEVMNFGVTGYGTAEELETLRHRVLQFKPDMVILFFYTGNDIYNNSLDLDPEPNRLHYVLDDEGQLSRLPFAVNDNALKRWLRHHSRTFLFVRDKIKSFQAMHRAMMAIGLMQEDSTSAESGQRSNVGMLQDLQYLRESPEQLEKAWRITKALLREIALVASVESIDFGMAVIPTREEIADAPPPDGIPASQWNRRRSVEETTEICRQLQIDCLQLVDRFRRPTVVNEDCFFDEGHWTEKGHAVAAEGIYEWLERSLCRENTPDKSEEF
jgi:lysophospholipase L1-like esterase